MRFSTHSTAGFLVGFASLHLIQASPVLMFAVLFGSIFPDLDLISSKPSRKLKHSAEVLSTLFRHRGFLHSLWLPLGIILLSTLFFPILLELAIGFLAGYSTHLLLDSFTRRGIHLFYPLKWPYLKGPLKTGGLIDMLLTFVFGIAAVLLALLI